MALFGKRNRQDINLIPEEQQALKTQRSKRGLVVFVVVIFTLVVASYVVAFVLTQVANSTNQKIESDTKAELVNWERQATVAASLKQIKTKLPSYKTAVASNAALEEKLVTIAQSTPLKVQLTDLSLDPAGKAVVVARADSAATAYQLIEVLKSKTSEFVDVKLTSLQKGDSAEVTLNFSMTVK